MTLDKSCQKLNEKEVSEIQVIELQVHHSFHRRMCNYVSDNL